MAGERALVSGLHRVDLFQPLADGSSRPGNRPLTVTYDLVEVSQKKLHRQGGRKKARLLTKQIKSIAGHLVASDTSSRKAPPGPASGQDLAGTFMDKGHLIALQLGGVDDKLNIVPQCKYWQESGYWRQSVEVWIYQNLVLTGKPYQYFMTVDCLYGRDPCNPKAFQVVVTDTHAGNKVAFHDTTENMFSDKDFEQLEKKFEFEYNHDYADNVYVMYGFDDGDDVSDGEQDDDDYRRLVREARAGLPIDENQWPDDPMETEFNPAIPPGQPAQQALRKRKRT